MEGGDTKTEETAVDKSSSQEDVHLTTEKSQSSESKAGGPSGDAVQKKTDIGSSDDQSDIKETSATQAKSQDEAGTDNANKEALPQDKIQESSNIEDAKSSEVHAEKQEGSAFAESAEGSGASDLDSDCEIVDEFLDDDGWEVMDEADEDDSHSQDTKASGKRGDSADRKGGKHSAKESHLQKKLKEGKLPVLGAEYLLEQKFFSDSQARYRCYLCWQDLYNESSVTNHLLNHNHRLSYLASHLTVLEGLFPSVSYRLWPQEWKTALDDLCFKLHEMFGFLNVTHIARYTPHITQKIMTSKHYSEENFSSDELDTLRTVITAGRTPFTIKRHGNKSDHQPSKKTAKTTSHLHAGKEKMKSKDAGSGQQETKGSELSTKADDTAEQKSEASGNEPEVGSATESSAVAESSGSGDKPNSHNKESGDTDNEKLQTKSETGEPADVGEESDEASDFAEGDELAGWEVMDEAGDDAAEGSSRSSHSAKRDAGRDSGHHSGGRGTKYEGKLQVRLKKLKLPIIGTEYILEQHLRGGQQLLYRCYLCYKNLTEGSVTNHLMARTHRMTYLVTHLPSLEAVFPRENYSLWSSEWKDALDNLCVKLQEKLGFMDIPLVRKYTPYIGEKILRSKHYTDDAISVADFEFPAIDTKPKHTASHKPDGKGVEKNSQHDSDKTSGPQAESNASDGSESAKVESSGKADGSEVTTADKAKSMADVETEGSAKAISAVSEGSEHETGDMSDDEGDEFFDDWEVMDEAGDDLTEDNASEGSSAKRRKVSGSKSDDAAIQAKLQKAKSPFIGAEYILEQVIRGTSEYRYRCYLCWTDLVKDYVPTHLLSTRHRMKYLNMHLPSFVAMFPVEYPRTWPQKWIDALDGLCAKLFEIFGLMKVTVARHYRPNIVEEIFNSKHYSEDKVSFADFKFPEVSVKKSGVTSKTRGEHSHKREGTKENSTKASKRPASREHSDTKKKAKIDPNQDESKLGKIAKTTDSKKSTLEMSDTDQLKSNENTQESLMDTVTEGSFSDSIAGNVCDSGNSQSEVECLDGSHSDVTFELSKPSIEKMPSKAKVKDAKSKLGEGKEPGKDEVSRDKPQQSPTVKTSTDEVRDAEESREDTEHAADDSPEV